MLETEVERITAVQNVLLIMSMIAIPRIDFLFGGKAQQPRFSPDAVNSLRPQRNLYIKNVKNTITQVTNDGSEHIINGLTDWVYEEEFGFVRAFDWNADGSSIAFMRFNETEVLNFPWTSTARPVSYPYTFKYPKTGRKCFISLHLYQLQTGTIEKIKLGDGAYDYIPRMQFAHRPIV